MLVIADTHVLVGTVVGLQQRFFVPVCPILATVHEHNTARMAGAYNCQRSSSSISLISHRSSIASSFTIWSACWSAMMDEHSCMMRSCICLVKPCCCDAEALVLACNVAGVASGDLHTDHRSCTSCNLQAPRCCPGIKSSTAVEQSPGREHSRAAAEHPLCEHNGIDSGAH